MKKLIITLAISLMTILTFGQKQETINCQIWKTESFCNLPDSVNVPGAVHYYETFVYGESCETLDKQNLVGVWVTFQKKKVTELNLTSHFNNISLIRKNTKEVLHPVAYMERSEPIGEEGNPQYMNNKSTFAKCTYELNPNEKYDLFILFEAAEVGDKLIIEDFLEAEIK